MLLVCFRTTVSAPECGLVLDRSRNRTVVTAVGALERDEQPDAEGRAQRLAKVFPLDGPPVDVEVLLDARQVLHHQRQVAQLRRLKHFLVDLPDASVVVRPVGSLVAAVHGLDVGQSAQEPSVIREDARCVDETNHGDDHLGAGRSRLQGPTYRHAVDDERGGRKQTNHQPRCRHHLDHRRVVDRD